MNSNELTVKKVSRALQVWRIWVIDDDPLIRTLIRSVLDQELFPARLDILEFSNFRSAQEALREPPDLDLVILDNYLEDGDGIDLLPQIAAFNSQSSGRTLPAIMISTNDDQEFQAQCFARGAFDYLTKPFNVSLMGYKVHALLVAKRNQDRIFEQKAQLERLIAARKREEEVARFTYDFYLRRTERVERGVWTRLKTPNAFSGDLMLSAHSPEGRMVFMLADATGHDLSAAITLIPVISRFHRMVEKGYRLPQLLLEINDRLLEDTPGDRFIAAVFIEIDPQLRKLHIWNGGMPPVLEVTQSGAVYEEYRAEHMALGILENGDFSTASQVVELSDDHWFLLFSDGLLEQQSEAGEHFDMSLLRENLIGGPAASIEQLERAHEVFRGTAPKKDDVSFCAIEPVSAISEVHGISGGQPDADTLGSLRNHAFFDWYAGLAGSQIGRTHIPVLCRNILSELDVSQDLSERIFTIITELYLNAVDHGLLKLPSELKEGPDGFFAYMQEREKRIASLSGEDRVSVRITWNPACTPQTLEISVVDTGEGFQRVSGAEFGDPYSCFGRGLSLVEHLATRLDIKPPGNHVTAVLELKSAA